MSTGAKDWVVVTGASGALGGGVVARFAELGYPVLGLDQNASGSSQGSSVVERILDLTQAESVDQVLEECVPRSQKIGILVNAMGLIWNEPTIAMRGAALRAHDAEAWRRVIEVNLTAPFLVASRVAARMARKGGGLIVNFSSISGRGNPGQPAYSAAKAGIEGMTRAMAAELGPMRVRVNAIAPGFIDVPSTRSALSAEQLSGLRARTPLRELGSLEDILKAIEFLVDSPFVTGAVLDINGGLRI